jgi:hypothetical protein
MGLWQSSCFGWQSSSFPRIATPGHAQPISRHLGLPFLRGCPLPPATLPLALCRDLPAGLPHRCPQQLPPAAPAPAPAAAAAQALPQPVPHMLLLLLRELVPTIAAHQASQHPRPPSPQQRDQPPAPPILLRPVAAPLWWSLGPPPPPPPPPPPAVEAFPASLQHSLLPRCPASARSGPNPETRAAGAAAAPRPAGQALFVV